ncbi:mannose-6-phosphate isomerase, class I [Leucobacter albus]|uniref:mannose-6-phosphate isomerase n=1 Tax=Leucobacter albus TaxID=272210 RepID=A0ABW3TMI6_9MICO
MLLFISNVPRAYSWGSVDVLPEMLGIDSNGEPQAELWLGDHPGSPASLAKGPHPPLTLIDLIAKDPVRYGVNGGPLPFLLKVLAIGAPLSLQVHPSREQAKQGFLKETSAGVPVESPERCYRDENHKPELLVALSEVTALSGFRSIVETVADMRALASLAPDGGQALLAAAERLGHGVGDTARQEFLQWAFGDPVGTSAVLEDIEAALNVWEERWAFHGAVGRQDSFEGVNADRANALRMLIEHHAGDPGVLVSLLLHCVRLNPGEAIFLAPQQLHAYLSGVAVEVMAASDNVLRAGLTDKHIDAEELLRILDYGALPEPRFSATAVLPGLCAWNPKVQDFQLLRARVRTQVNEGAHSPWAGPGDGNLLAHSSTSASTDASAQSVSISAPTPLVLIVTTGRVLVTRSGNDLAEFANVARGQSLYVSAGEPIRLSGDGEAFLATTGG